MIYNDNDLQNAGLKEPVAEKVLKPVARSLFLHLTILGQGNV